MCHASLSSARPRLLTFNLFPPECDCHKNFVVVLKQKWQMWNEVKHECKAGEKFRRSLDFIIFCTTSCCKIMQRSVLMCWKTHDTMQNTNLMMQNTNLERRLLLVNITRTLFSMQVMCALHHFWTTIRESMAWLKPASDIATSQDWWKFSHSAEIGDFTTLSAFCLLMTTNPSSFSGNSLLHEIGINGQNFCFSSFETAVWCSHNDRFHQRTHLQVSYILLEQPAC